MYGLTKHYLHVDSFWFLISQNILNRRLLKMPKAKKTWSEKMIAKPPHQVVLEKDFAGVKQGSTLHISSPQEIADELRKILPGTTLSIQQLRQNIANFQKCDATCPVSTSIFLRIVAEHAWEEFNLHNNQQDIAPFWRVIDPESSLAKKLSFDPAWIRLQREMETKP